MDKPTVVDLFSGAGLFSEAFRSVGFRIIRALEKDTVAASTYQRNLGKHIECCDVREAIPDGSCSVLIAGPPCQGFSTLGSRNPNDERNTLSLEVVRFAKKLRPEVVVIENVASFINSEIWSRVVRSLRGCGYSVQSCVLNAADFGVSQLRKRSFTIAFRGRKCPDLSFKTRNARTVRQALHGLPEIPDGRNAHYAPIPSELALSRFKVIPSGGDKRDVMKTAPNLVPSSWWKCAGEVTDVWGRMEWDRPANTLRTCLLNPSKGRYIHPDQNRVISLREAARIHGIRDSWQFEGLPTQIARQIGNSVPPPLGRVVARTLLELLG